MKIGDVVTVTSIKHSFPDGWMNYVAPKGQYFVVLLLGVEDKKVGLLKLDPEVELNKMGWMKNPKWPTKTKK